MTTETLKVKCYNCNMELLIEKQSNKTWLGKCYICNWIVILHQ